MCGIAGAVGGNLYPEVTRMVASLRHRGPDDSGVAQLEGAVLGMSRLSIIDLSDAGHQPMSSPDGLVTIVYNGETYNFGEERARLQKAGWQFQSHSDTEVVLALYLERGDRCVERMRGMFAFAIWDARTNALLIARDRLGIKPLYYTATPRTLVFASELRALLASGLVDAAIDRGAVDALLAFGSIAQPATIVEGVFALPPAHLARYQDGQLTIRRYWDLPPATDTAPAVFADAVVQLRERLREAVRLSLVSDVPVGVFLSAGADSAAVLALAVESGAEAPRTFSIGFESEVDGPWSETDGAEATARFFQSRHESAIVGDNEVAGLFDRFVEALDQPSVDGLNTYLVSRLASSHVKVALSGLGGDELFGGYTRAVSAFWQAERLSNPLIRAALRAGYSGIGLFDRVGMLPGLAARFEIKYGLHPGRAYAATRRLFDPASLRHAEDAKGEEAVADLIASDDPHLADPIARVSRLDLTSFVPFQLLRDMDAVSMRHSLEVRFPLLDHELVEWAYRLPARFKYAGRNRGDAEREGQSTYADAGTKRILFAAIAPLLPPDVMNRRKQGFKLPMSRWMKTVLHPRMMDLLSSAPPRGLSNEEWVALRSACNHGRLSGAQLWLLLVLGTWERSLLRSAAAA